MTPSRVLLVDDERDIANAIKMGLEKNGFKVEIFYDPVKALANFKPDSYDLLISDVKMPNMNGFEMVYEMKLIDPDLQVIFFTGHEDMYREVSKLFDKMKVRDVIKKPVGIHELVEKINALNVSGTESANATGGTRSTVLLEKTGGVRSTQAAPRVPTREFQDFILGTLDGNRMTLGALAQRMRPRSDFTWQEFTESVDYLISKGRLQSRGDGFDVIYSVTMEGERTIKRR